MLVQEFKEDAAVPWKILDLFTEIVVQAIIPAKTPEGVKHHG